MKVVDWLNKVIDSNILCEGYCEKVKKAKGKKSLMDIVLDANGSTWLCEMDAKGNPLPYEYIESEFGSYINGRYKADFGKYSSSLYCCYSFDDMIIDTTVTTFLGCTTKVIIQENSIVNIVADKNCDLSIRCPQTSRCIIDCWGNAKIDVLCLNNENVKVIRH